jgi:hypothetical protein
VDRRWTDRDALRHDPRWKRVRAKAAAALDAFGWPQELPRKQDTVFLEGLGLVPGR